MKDRGKAEWEAYKNSDYFGETSFPCTKHPSSTTSSADGICAYCLTDKLVQLVCPKCGEQRLSSCSCSEPFSSDPNSSSSAEVGSVRRISFLLENDKNVTQILPNKMDHEPQSLNHVHQDFASLRRSNSTCVDINNRGRETRSSGAFSKLGKLFRKQRDKKSYINTHNRDENDENKTEMGMSECVGVSRSRSLCSFRGFHDTDESGVFPVSSSSAARASNVSGNFMLDSAKMSCFSESEARISNFDYDAGFVGPNKNIFSMKESEFVSCADDPSFIDLKLHDVSSNLRPDLPLPALRRGGFGMSTREFGYNRNEEITGHEMFKNGGGSCRISVGERELRKSKKSNKVWKWFFRHQTSSRRKDDDHAFNS